MSTPRDVRLVRVPGLRAMHRALAALTLTGDPLDALQRVVLVPSAAAATHLRETFERTWCVDGWRPPLAWRDALGVARADGAPVFVAPAMLTRDAFLAGLAESLGLDAMLLDTFSRDALMRLAVRHADTGQTSAPFLVRPGIIAEMVHFYDAIRRHMRTVDDFDRLLVGALEDEADVDRGAARLLSQTRFLASAFREFERLTRDARGLDEHAVRLLATHGGHEAPWHHVIVAVADQAAEPAGLWPADFDLLARMPGVTRIDVIATDAVLDTGWRERLDGRLPGVSEVRLDTVDAMPTLVVPGDADAPYFVARDREAELEMVARSTKLDAVDGRRRPHDVMVVVQRPLPYMYLARHAFAQAGVPWTASDALPLAAEPFVAACDLAVSCLFGNFTRADLVQLLGSPLYDFGSGPLSPQAVAEFDAHLGRAQYFADRERLAALAASFDEDAGVAEDEGDESASSRAVASSVATILAALPELDPPRRMSDYLSALHAFVERFVRTGGDDLVEHERHLRARRALLDALAAMERACLAHDDPALPFRDVVAIIRRWVESQTFSPRIGRDGVRVVDATSARFADADALWVAGLLEGEWPPAHGRMTFYSSDLLAELGWPSERLRLLADRATFDDLLRAARSQVAMSTVSLEDETVTRPSVYLDDLDVAAFPLERTPLATARVAADEAMLLDPIVPHTFDGETRSWLEWRLGRGDLSAPGFRGSVGTYARPRHTVTALETYLECPFRYFARHVLMLDEPDEEADGLSPKDSGRLLHAALERFIQRFDGARIDVDDPAAADDARRIFAETVDEVLVDLDERDRAIERTRLLGSALAVGAGERVLALEFEHPGDALVERRLESAFDRDVTVAAADRVRDVRLRGKIDRVDVFADGTFRVVDYKRGNSAPSGSKALQLPIYALAVEQGARDAAGALTVREAMYLALGPRGATSRVIKPATRDEVMAGAQARLLGALDGIERGEFPPRPREIHLCIRCAFARVCRKDYVDDGEAAEA